jgi:hypothetical protein
LDLPTFFGEMQNGSGTDVSDGGDPDDSIGILGGGSGDDSFGPFQDSDDDDDDDDDDLKIL